MAESKLIKAEVVQVTPTELNAALPAIVDRYMAVRAFAQSVLQPGTDYGKIPGCGDKDTLLLPGAQKIRDFFGLHIELHLEEKVQDWTGKDHNGEPFFFYLTRACVYRNGQLTATAYGSCNSWEKKYRWREAKRQCPNCGSEALRKSKNPGEGWYCWAKIGGCGAKFGETDERISSQKVGLERNPDIYDLPNTLIKMSNKRAFVSGVLYATGLSEFFTADIEDFASDEPVLPPSQNLDKVEAVQKVRSLIKSLNWSVKQARDYAIENIGVASSEQMTIAQLNDFATQLMAIAHRCPDHKEPKKHLY